ncbi:flagellar basal body L-ring protein FlgH [Sporolituus thermophilus]|uniref:Flagellar L-ring protein n=1 Tax=Sporolituus thermophilus DSM 23256 TaxID=1123285 RepID=A0A1G7HFU1_9FIRM|nr:flagellar basal body L-ring protein FlgH [Sporolituus thermophilus]SDE99367.1 flagellar L-ring protein precursor FlgH [Sporolituus thermophilus DSM 23256]
MGHKAVVILITAVLMASALAPAAPAAAASLWTDSGPAANMYADRKAHAVGDIITIIISESSSASRTGKAENAKSGSTDMQAGVGIFHWLADASAGYSDSFKSQGTIANSNNVSAKLTVQVVEVKPNGNMVVSGTQSIKQNGEEQRITVTGVVRPDDVRADNTVLSTYVADAQIRIEGHGPLARKQRQGVLSQILNILF